MGRSSPRASNPLGDDSSAVQNQLKNVQQIQANRKAFAAILCDGSVVAWGDADLGAVLGDGPVVPWDSTLYVGET